MSDDKVRLWRTHEVVAPVDADLGRPEWHEDRVADESYAYPDSEWIARPVADDDAREERLKRAEEQRDALAQECSETEHVAREAGADESIMPFPVALHDLLTRLTDERDDATRDRDEWKARAERAEAERIAEVAEFNAGYDAYKAKKPLDEAEAEYTAGLPVTPEGYTPVSTPYDVFACGYAWAAWDDLRRELREVKAERDSARALLREARPCVSSAKINAMGYCDTEERLADLLARIDAEAGGGK